MKLSPTSVILQLQVKVFMPETDEELCGQMIYENEINFDEYLYYLPGKVCICLSRTHAHSSLLVILQLVIKYNIRLCILVLVTS